ncbi:hypothetical protein [Luteithermobacter gelatinilyticus]|uniref:hypothetical protein n=1 Tax=Luteithermobacter gelatinilyticus TaxID=2582913 RepID=UPI001106652D|nr:hypothetical protein [Luteithermobacter gelatinilyticus]|tara:strand:- start:2069 stop:2509 length:441 start_codon:yes stop_codon:yes gene_type:complete
MSRIFKTVLLIIIASTFSTAAIAADRAYDKKHPWHITLVETKPGMYDDYLADLKNVWRKFMEEEKKAGNVLSYKMFNMIGTDKGRANLVLMVEYKNWAVFDRSYDDWDKLIEKVMGSMDKAQQATIDRGALRTILGERIAEEIVFK